MLRRATQYGQCQMEVIAKTIAAHVVTLRKMLTVPARAKGSIASLALQTHLQGQLPCRAAEG